MNVGGYLIVYEEPDDRDPTYYHPLVYAVNNDDVWLLKRSEHLYHRLNEIHTTHLHPPEIGEEITYAIGLLLTLAVDHDCSVAVFRRLCYMRANAGHPQSYEVPIFRYAFEEGRYEACRVLLEWGGIDKSQLESIIGFNEWYRDACVERVACRKATICIMGLSRTKFGGGAIIPKDVLKKIAKPLWETRFEELTWMQETKVDLTVLERVGNMLKSVSQLHHSIYHSLFPIEWDQ